MRTIKHGGITVSMPIGSGPIPSNEDLAYAAGVVDCDGSIQINISRWRSGGVKLTMPTYALMLIVAAAGATGKRFVSWMARTFHKPYRMEPPRVTHKYGYRVFWAGFRANRILTMLFPFLIAKRDQALLTMKFQALKRRHPGGRAIDTKLRSLMRRMWLQMKTLHRVN